jgi:hypothetical protein
MPELNMAEASLRIVLFVTGLWVAGHHFCASNALQRAPVLVKMALMPATVASGVGMAWASAFSGSGLALLFALPAVVLMSITEALVWRAGLYISAAFERQAEMRQREREGFNRMMNYTTAPAYDLADLVSKSGQAVVEGMERRESQQ